MATPNLNLPHITAGQVNKETTANLQADGLDKATHSTYPITITGDRVLTVAELRENKVFILNGSPGGAFVLSVPAGVSKPFMVINQTGQNCLVEMFAEGTDAVLVGVRQFRILHTDGTDIFIASGGGSGEEGLTIFQDGVVIAAGQFQIDFGVGLDIDINTEDRVDVSNPPPPIKNVLTADYTFVPEDAGCMVRGFSSTNGNWYIDASLFPANTVIEIIQWDTGTITITEDDSQTVVFSRGDLFTTAGPKAVLMLKIVDTSSVVLIGDAV